MKHYFRSVGLILAAAMPLTACGAQTGNVDDTAAVTSSVNEAQSENDKPADDFHKQMVDRSLYSLGNTQRLKAKMEKARSGEETTVAYIGGSITEGAMGGPLGCYAYLSYEYFRDTYGNGDNVKYINAGFSGTSSTLGVLRAERDVLSKNADIVFVEFSVNDTMEVVSKEAYESLVRTILETDNEPAVVLLFNRMEGGYSAQPHMKEIGSQYDLPMISVADAITAEFDEGRMTWGDFSEDYAHPTKDGHKLVCEFIENMYQAAEAAPDSEQYVLPDTPKFGTAFKSPALITPELNSDRITIADMGSFEVKQAGSQGFDKCWQLCDGTSPIKFDTKGNTLFVIYRRNKTEDMGSFDILVNGAKLKTINTYNKDSWGEAFPELVIKFQTNKDMTVEIVPCEGSEDKKIQILGIGSAENGKKIGI